MTYGEFVRRTITLVIIVFFTVFLVSAITTLKSILLTIFFCWILSIGLNALIIRLQKRGIPRTLAALITLLGVVVAIILIAATVIPPFINQFQNLIESIPDAGQSAVSSYVDLRERYDFLTEVLPEFTVEDYENFINADLNDIIDVEQVGEFDLQAVNLESILGSALPIIGGIGNVVGSLIANLLLIILITGYLLADPLVYYRPIVALMPKDREERVVQLINEIRKDVTSWMAGLSVSVLFTSVTVWLSMDFILNVPNAFALGVIAGVATFIPNVGYYIGLIPIILFTAATDITKVIPAAVIYWGLNQVEGSFISPNIMKRQLNLPAGILLPFQIIAAATLGFYGILLAVPILAIIVSVVEELYIFDVLGKRGWRSGVTQDPDGTIHLTTDDEPQAKDREQPAPAT